MIVVAAIAVGVAIWAVAGRNAALKQGETQKGDIQQTESSKTGKKEPVEKLTDSINLPGYGWINLKADTAEQDMTIPNPEENYCQIRISLMLEDGTVLWTSELVQPGEESAPIVLNEPLAKGTYNGVLKYECFDTDENMTQLNGAQAQLKLKVY